MKKPNFFRTSSVIDECSVAPTSPSRSDSCPDPDNKSTHDLAHHEWQILPEEHTGDGIVEMSAHHATLGFELTLREIRTQLSVIIRHINRETGRELARTELVKKLRTHYTRVRTQQQGTDVLHLVKYARRSGNVALLLQGTNQPAFKTYQAFLEW